MTQQSTTATSARPTAETLFNETDNLEAWVIAHPKRAAAAIRGLRNKVAKLEAYAFEQSWRQNPDRMGS